MSEGGGEVELGIPPKEVWWITNVILPFTFYSLNWKAARDLFKEEMNTILRSVRPLSLDQLNHPVFIKRLTGLQESSRIWSPGMVLDHLNKFNNLVAQIIPALQANRVLTSAMTLESIKPSVGHNLDTIARFEQMGRLFGETEMTNYILRESSEMQFRHPWLGALDQQQWLKVAAVHMKLHRRQLDLMLKEILRA